MVSLSSLCHMDALFFFLSFIFFCLKNLIHTSEFAPNSFSFSSFTWAPSISVKTWCPSLSFVQSATSSVSLTRTSSVKSPASHTDPSDFLVTRKCPVYGATHRLTHDKQNRFKLCLIADSPPRFLRESCRTAESYIMVSLL